MIQKLRSLLFLAFSFGILNSGCTAPEKFDIVGFLGMQQIPVITGIHVTTNDQPEGTGQTYGVPSYSIERSGFKRINVFPNPYIVRQPPEIRIPRFVTFTHLPRLVTVTIIEGIWQGERPITERNIGGTVASNVTLRIVRTFKKSDDSQFLRWDLKDESGNYILSGFYRVYFHSAQIDSIHWVDLYLIQCEDVSTWVDPTGWLPKDWNAGLVPCLSDKF
jgi:hypothetical protein